MKKQIELQNIEQIIELQWDSDTMQLVDDDNKLWGRYIANLDTLHFFLQENFHNFDYEIIDL